MTLETKRMEPGADQPVVPEGTGHVRLGMLYLRGPQRVPVPARRGEDAALVPRVRGLPAAVSKTITGDIFEFGFSDSILQMWAAFMAELDGRTLSFGCVKPEQTRLSHALLTAALRSHAEGRAVPLRETL